MKAFTLIEMLVVVAIVALLASLLLPALSAGRRKADSVRCVNNLRQIGIALRLYADENEARLPSVQRPLTTSAARQRALPAILHSQLSGNRDLFWCPEDEEEEAQARDSSYEWNFALNGRILHRIENPAGIHLMRDLAPWHRGPARNALYVDGHVAPETVR